MDKVSNEIKKAINDYGKEIVTERRLVYILSDYGVLKDFRAERRILFDIIDDGYASSILQLSKETGDASLKICAFISDMHKRYGYQIRKLITVYQWFVEGLGMKTIPFDSILHYHPDEETIVDIVIKGKYNVKDPFSLLPNYRLPEVSLYTETANSTEDITPIEIHIQTILNDYGIKIEELVSYQTPVMYYITFSLSSGIRITKLQYLKDKISEALSPIGSRLLVPIPGTNRIGVEIPKVKPNNISFFPALSTNRQTNQNGLYCSIGLEPDGTPFSFYLENAGHVLISGMPKSGKTNCIHSIILSLLSWCNPCELKFAIISSNNASFNSYENIAKNFLVKSHSGDYIAKNEEQISMLLSDLEQEIDYRKKLLAKADSATIKDYNVKFMTGDLNPDEGHVFLPYIVIIVDELSELNEIKNANYAINSFVKNGQDCGLCLVLATGKRIKRAFLSEETKKCLHTKITFRHENLIMAKSFMDSNESLYLMPFGDFLYQDGLTYNIKRVSNALIEEKTKDVLIQYLLTQPSSKYDYLLKHSEGTNTITGYGHSLLTDKELFIKAAQLVVSNKKCNEAFLQKELRCSFNTAHEMILRFDEIGVTKKNGSSRTVLVYTFDELNRLLK